MRALAAVTRGLSTPSGRALGTDALLGGLVLAPIVLPAGVPSHLPVLCPFRAITGLPCPGCGLTRSFFALGHLHVADSFAFHPFGPLLYAVVSFVLLWRLFERSCGRRPVEVETLWRDRRTRRLLLPGLALWLVWAFARAVAVLL